VDQEDQGDHNPPWWTRSGFYILLMQYNGGRCGGGPLAEGSPVDKVGFGD